MPSPPPPQVGVPPTPNPTETGLPLSPPPLNEMALAYASLVAKYAGHYVNVSNNPYGAQCVELCNAWNDLLGIARFPGNAADFEFISHPDCTWTPNTPTNVPPVGSHVIWGKSPNLKFGHCGVGGIASVLKFTSFDQNWPIGSPAHQQDHTYGGVRGWLTPILSHITWRPPNTQPIQPGMTGAQGGLRPVNRATKEWIIQMMYLTLLHRTVESQAMLDDWVSKVRDDGSNLNAIVAQMAFGPEAVTVRNIEAALRADWASRHAGPGY